MLCNIRIILVSACFGESDCSNLAVAQVKAVPDSQDITDIFGTDWNLSVGRFFLDTVVNLLDSVVRLAYNFICVDWKDQYRV